MTLPGRKFSAWAAVALAAALFLALNVLSQAALRTARLDLTEGRLYTLSGGTRAMLESMAEPITVRFFFSESLAADLPGFRQYAQRVRELLETYAARAGGAMALQVIDPEPFSPAEDEAVALGLRGVPLTEQGERLYFGMAATNTTDDLEVVPFFQDAREAFLEYDLTRAFHRLANPKRPVVGLISTLPVDGGFDPQRGAQPAWTVAEQIRQLFELRDLTTEVAEVPGDVDVLMVVHPRDLPGATRYAIDQFVLGGGKAMVFVDPFSEAAAGVPDPENPMRLHNSRLPGLFAAWGVELAPGMIVGDRLTARKVRGGTRERPVAVDYIAWLALGADNFDRENIVTAQLGAINVATVGVLSPVEGAATEFTPLIRSSNEAMLFERMHVQFMPDPAQLLADFAATGESYVMAARVSGPAETAFPDGPPPPEDDSAASDPAAADEDEGGDSAPALPDGHRAASDGPINVLIVADSDLLSDRFWVQAGNFIGQDVIVPVADNGAFAVNALDVYAGSSELIGLRSRRTSDRPFTVVRALERQAEERFRETEEMLQAQVRETEAQLAELQVGGDESQPVLTPEQQASIAAFRERLVSTRRQLREVQLALRRDIERLGSGLQFLNVALVPILVALVGLVVALLRARRRRRALAAAG